MKKLIIFLIILYPTILVGGVLWAIMFDFDVMHNVIVEMDKSLNSANNYCVNQVQDIEQLQERLSTNPTSKYEYTRWLNAMQDMKEIRIDEDGSISERNVTASPDSIFQNRYIKKLKDESVKTEAIMTPLNFGITYLDRQQLEQDAEEYILRKIRDLNDRMGFGRYGVYRVDPATVDVQVAITSRPINLVDITEDTGTHEQYLKLFGTNDVLDGTTSSEGRRMSNIIVEYTVDYYLYYDYIPSSFMFKVDSRIINRMDLGDAGSPPKHIYFPFWFLRDGSINPDSRQKLAGPVYKLSPTNAFEYSYNYILTN